MVKTLFLAAIVAVLLLPSLAPAQSAAVDTQIGIEAKRRRVIVRPEPPVPAAIRDAERAAADTSGAELAREANDPVRRQPQLDYDVTNSIQARNLPRGAVAPQRGPNR
jgi:hypothetical protein